MFYFLMLSR
uniref:Uncharacterized protein n=1 Tax=Rhizophora mucronata TaxID=61149 RepID=A0A2P2NQE2_RHIMU